MESMEDNITSAPAAEAPAAAPEAASTPAEPTDAQLDEAEAAVDAEESGEAPKADDKAAAAAAKKAEAKAKAEIKKWKLKVDGKEEELDEEALLKHASMGKAAQARMKEAAELRKNVESFITALQKDPLKVLSDPGLGIDPATRKALAESILNGEIEEMQKTPEQRELDKARKELEALKDAQKKAEEKRKRDEFERLQEQAEKQLDKDITTALEGSGLPKSPYTVKKLADFMMLALQNNVDITAADAIPLLKKQINSEIKEMFAATPEDMIEEFLGKDNISRLRKRNLAKIRSQAKPQSAADIKSTGSAEKQEDAPKKLSMRDFLKGSLV
jgi:hypothetical protein